MTNNIIFDKSIEFALAVIELFQALQKSWEYVISKQLLRSGTSIWANIAEANAAQSKKDFYAKMCIAYKEAHESKYWLLLLERSKLTQLDVSQLQEDCEEIIRLLAKIKLTTENNLKNP